MTEKEESPAGTPTTSMSKLSLQLETSAGDPDNPYMEYAKYDGKVCV